MLKRLASTSTTCHSILTSILHRLDDNTANSLLITICHYLDNPTPLLRTCRRLSQIPILRGSYNTFHEDLNASLPLAPSLNHYVRCLARLQRHRIGGLNGQPELETIIHTDSFRALTQQALSTETDIQALFTQNHLLTTDQQSLLLACARLKTRPVTHHSLFPLKLVASLTNYQPFPTINADIQDYINIHLLEPKQTLFDRINRHPFSSDTQRRCKSLIQANPFLMLAIDHNRETLLHHASASGHLSFVTFLVESSTSTIINGQDKTGSTPLHLAAEYGHLEVIQCLIRGGADANKADKNGDRPINDAQINNHVEVIRELMRAGGAAHLTIDEDYPPDWF